MTQPMRTDVDEPVLPVASATATTPERCLLVGVLERAAADLLDPRGKHRASVVRWLGSDAETPGAFAWACRHLGLEPGWVRRRLLAVLPTTGAAGGAGSDDVMQESRRRCAP